VKWPLPSSPSAATTTLRFDRSFMACSSRRASGCEKNGLRWLCTEGAKRI